MYIMIFVYIHYFAERLPDAASEGILNGDCSERLRSTNEINLERARKGFGARAKRLRNKQPAYDMFLVYTFYYMQ